MEGQYDLQTLYLYFRSFWNHAPHLTVTRAGSHPPTRPGASEGRYVTCSLRVVLEMVRVVLEMVRAVRSRARSPDDPRSSIGPRASRPWTDERQSSW